MSVKTDPVPNPPQHDPVIDPSPKAMGRFARSWMQWILLIRDKINIINAVVVGISAITGQGFAVLTSGFVWVTRSITNGAGITITNQDGSAGNPVVSHADTSSVADLNSDNSNRVVIQDYAITFDTFGHVQTVSVGTLDLDTVYGAALATGGTTAQFWRGDKSWSNTLTGNLVLSVGTSSVSPFSVSGNLTGSGRNATFTNTSTATTSAINLLFTAGTGSTHTFGAFAPEYTVVPVFTDRMVVESMGSGVTLSVQNASGTVDIRTDAARTLRWQVTALGNLLPGATSTYNIGSDASRVLRTTTRELVVGGQNASFGGGAGLMFMSNAITVPTTNPTNGAVWYVEAGASKARGSSGTTTTFGPAEPHCPVCGSDFTTEHENSEKYGYLSICLKCLADYLGDKPWIVRRSPN